MDKPQGSQTPLRFQQGRGQLASFGAYTVRRTLATQRGIELQLNLEVEVTEYGPAITKLTLTAEDGGRIRPADLRAISLSKILRSAQRGATLLKTKTEHGYKYTPLLPDRLRKVEPTLGVYKGRPKQLDDAHYERVAEIYRFAVADGSQPVIAVQQAMMCSRPTAGRYVQEARRRVLLPPTTSGKAKA